MRCYPIAPLTDINSDRSRLREHYIVYKMTRDAVSLSLDKHAARGKIISLFLSDESYK